MSSTDTDFTKSLGISIAELASAMKKSRQTLSRGFKNEDHYLNSRNLSQAFEYWHATDGTFYEIAKNKLCDFFPSFAQTIIDSIEKNSDSVVFDAGVVGEYTLVCGEFLQFEKHHQKCFSELCKVIKMNNRGQINVVVNKKDYKTAKLAFAKFDNIPQLQIIQCNTVDLSLMPTLLVRVDMNDNTNLFGASSNRGFISLSKNEGGRVRQNLDRLIFENAAPEIHAVE